MGVNITIESDKVVCTGDGADILRLKTEISSFLGYHSVEANTPNSFTFPLHLSAHVMSLLEDYASVIPHQLKSLEEVFREHEQARQTAMDVLIEGSAKNIPEFWRSVLDPVQSIAVSSMITDGLIGICLFDEQGIGKTVMAIASLDILIENEGVDQAVIVCPKTMIHGWKNDFEKFLQNKYKIVATGENGEKNRNIFLKDSDVLIMNFEIVDRHLSLIKSHSSASRTLLIIDESFFVKNKEARRSAAVLSLRKSCKLAFVLCGTPAPNSPDDIIHQFNIADNGYTFGLYRPNSDPNLNRLNIIKAIESRGAFIRRLKQEALPDLPVKEFNIITVPLEGRQASLYEESRKSLELKLRKMDNSEFKRSLATYFQQRAVLLQLCILPQMIDPLFNDIPAKYVVLEKLVTELAEKHRRKVILWTVYKASIDYTLQRFKRFNPIRLDGSQSANERQAAIDKFQKDSDCLICVANPMAAGSGVTLHSAADAVYLSYSNQAAHFFQSIDRIHRRGQEAQRTNYYLLVCKGTIEEGEVIRLKDKAKSQSDILGDQIFYPDTLEDALSEIIS